MGNSFIAIVPKKTSYPDKESKGQEILNWLISKDIVKKNLSDCILSANFGYAISDGARNVTNEPHFLPYNLIVNGLSICKTREVHTSMEGGIDECICPVCKENMVLNGLDFISDWYNSLSDSFKCSVCGVISDVFQFKFLPEWGFSDLAFIFYNWPDFKKEFIEEFKEKLDVEVSVVYAHI